ncbi:MAG TPA: right-handed parallel beta-helix repeat-containing protein, partial [Candidatus Cloacimonadota bacterium]|nr:right-handed parallel beta-helix repeat-containing protein [Candidatus Cloacimonadota bacterium]
YTDQLSRYIGKDFQFLDAYQANPDKENKIHIRVALKWDEATTNVEVCQIRLKALKLNATIGTTTVVTVENGNYDVNDPNYYVDLGLTQESDPLETIYHQYDTTIYNADLNDIQPDLHGFRLFEYEADMPYPGSQNVLEGSTCKNFRGIDPEIYWYGNTKLYIDYIEIEDEFHHSYRKYGENSEYITRLDTRLAQLNAPGMPHHEDIAMYMVHDEPAQGEFGMSKIVQDHLSLQGKKMMATVNLKDSWVIKPAGYQRYFHPGNYISTIVPDRLLMDAYPLGEGADESDRIHWNLNDNSNWIQNKIDNNLLVYYAALAKKVQSHPAYANTELYYCPQIYGEREFNTAGGYWTLLLPPKSMMKCLQFMPLCYGADGILSFIIDAYWPTSTSATGHYFIAPLRHDSGVGYNNLSDPFPPDLTRRGALTSLGDANLKIKEYGHIIKDLKWSNSDALMVTETHPSDLSISDFGLESIKVFHDPNPANTPYYEGYVQCGYYKDNNNIPWFMLVNRRAVYRTDGLTSSAPLDVDVAFTDAAPQKVRFTFDSSFIQQHGTVGIYDPYLHDLQILNSNRYAEVSIDAGDGSLRQVVETLPPRVTNAVTIHNLAYFQKNTVIYIQRGGSVTLDNNAKATLLHDCIIIVEDGGTLHLNGDIEFETGARIIVQNGGTYIHNATCKFAQQSGIEVQNGNLDINNSTLEGMNGETWNGLVLENCYLTMINSSLSDTPIGVYLNNSPAQITECHFNIPDSGIGINVIGDQNIPLTIQSSEQDATTFTAIIPNQGVGIEFQSKTTPLSITGAKFTNLAVGVDYYVSSAKADSIDNCQFENCLTGVNVTGSGGLYKILNCIVTVPPQGKGIFSQMYVPFIDGCGFYGGSRLNTIGIFLDYVHRGWTTRNRANITNCTFQQLTRGIESRGSQARLSLNFFNNNTSGIVEHQNSNLDCSYKTFNVFLNQVDNVFFYTDSTQAYPTYCATIQLMEGHNDFYHVNGCRDFTFGFGYDYHGLNNGRIDASGNYWSADPANGPDNQAIIYAPDNPNVINLGHCDETPNVTNLVVIPMTRFEQH